MEQVKQIVTDIKEGNLKPIYFLMGEEPYFIDKISEYILEHVLDETERGFNQMVIYGKDTTVEDIISNAKRYPMMAKYQVIVINEAQELSRSIDKLSTYAENPLPSTILVLNYKYKKIDKRKALYKAISKSGVVFESNTLYENQAGEWIKQFLKGQGYMIAPKGVQMLIDFIGTDLSKIANELSKLQIILPEGTEITPQDIEENIGISKDYNNFELRNAIATGAQTKAYKIVKYFAENPKENPTVVTISSLFNFFIQLLQLHSLQSQNPRDVASALKIHPYFVNEYITAAKRYPMKKVSSIINTLRQFDLYSKGVGVSHISQNDLLKELMVRIFM